MKVLEFIATGSEEIETLIPLDIMRRAGIDFKTVSITGSKNVETSHGVTIVADLLFEDADIDNADMLLLPGGMPGSINLTEHEGGKKALLKHNKKNKCLILG